MSVATTATYYAPSTVSSTTTSWIPLTTSYGAHGNGAGNLYYSDNAFWAWVPAMNGDTTKYLPPEVTQVWESSSYVDDPIHTVFSIGPFLGCPNLFTTAGTPSEGLTMCCPSSFGLYTPSGTKAWCTSAYTESVMTITQGGYITYSWELTSSGSSSSLTSIVPYITYETTSQLTSAAIVTAPAISGWNLAAAAIETNTAGASGSSATTVPTCSATSCPIPNGVVAGLAVTSVLGACGIGLFFVAGWLYMRSRRGAVADSAAGGVGGVGGGHSNYMPVPLETQQYSGQQSPTQGVTGVYDPSQPPQSQYASSIMQQQYASPQNYAQSIPYQATSAPVGYMGGHQELSDANNPKAELPATS